MIRDDFLKLMYQHSTGAGYVINCDTYELKFANPPMLRILSKEFDSWKGQTCYNFIYNLEKPCDFCKMKKMKIGQTIRWYHKSQFSNNDILMRDFKISLDGEEIFMQIAHSIPSQMKELKMLSADSTAEQLLSECAKTLMEEDNRMDKILEEITRFYGANSGFIYLKDDLFDKLSLKYIFSVNKGEQNDIPEIFYSENAEMFEKFINTPYFFINKQDLQNSSFADNNELFNLFEKNLLVTYLNINTIFVGFLAIADVSDNIEHLNIVSIITGFLKNHLKTENMIKDLNSQTLAFQTIINCVQTLITVDNFDEATKNLLSYLSEYFDAQRAYMINNNDGILEIANDFNSFEKNFAEKRLHKNSIENFNSWFDELGYENTLIIHDVKEVFSEKYPIEQKILEEQNVNQIMGIRLCQNDKVTNFLMLDNPTKHQNHAEVLQAVIQFVQSHLEKDMLLEKLFQLSYTDTLTKVYNRNFFNQYCENYQVKTSVGIIYVDVNGLKKANDNFGHEFGDTLIKWTGKFLATYSEGTVFRLGGDEFICILDGVTKENFVNIEKNLNKLLSEFNETHLSMGFLWTDVNDSITNLTKKADARMYEQKQKYYQKKSEDDRKICEELEDFKKEIIILEKYLENFDYRS